MTKYLVLDPEVAGGLGAHTEMDRSVHPPAVARLHYEFADWLGDCLVQSFPCFVVLAGPAEELVRGGMTGFALQEVEISTSSLFHEINPSRELPQFFWLKVWGVAGHDDFGLTSDGSLVVSRRAFALLESRGLSNCDVLEYPDTV